jgi:hypothetical protein
MHHGEPREDLPHSAPEDDLDLGRFLSSCEAQKRSLNQPSTDLGHYILVLGGRRQGERLAASHGRAEDEDGLLGGEFGGDEGYDVGEDLRRGTREALVGGLGDAFTPSALVEGEGLDVVGGEVAEEFFVAADVVAEAVDEDEFGFDGAGGLHDSWLSGVLVL